MRSGSADLRYAREVIDLLGAYPGRDFKPGHIVRYVASQRCELVRPRLRVGVHRVLVALVESGQVEPIVEQGELLDASRETEDEDLFA